MALMATGLLQWFSRGRGCSWGDGSVHPRGCQGWTEGSSAGLQHTGLLVLIPLLWDAPRALSPQLLTPSHFPRGYQRVLWGCNSLWLLFLMLLLTRRRCPQHGQHYRIQLFEGSCFGGHSMELTEDCSCLQGRGWEQPHVNAVRVYGDGA